MWRKRQALASDQQSWRGMRLGIGDSALWTSIDRNAGNVNTALGGSQATATTGIVSKLRMQSLGSAATFSTLDTRNPMVIVSDPGNPGAPEFSTPIDTSHNVVGSGLVFGIENFSGNSGTAVGLQTDVSGQKIVIYKGGSGYSVGQTFSMSGVAPFSGNGVIGVIESVISTDPVQPRN